MSGKTLSFSIVGIIALAVAGYFALHALGDKTSSALPEQTVDVGVLLPLSGTAIDAGITMRNALLLALDERNAQGGIQGNDVRYVYADGGCNGDDATKGMQELLSKGMRYVIGGLCSGETLAAAPIAEENEILLLSPTSSNPAITDAGDFVFRTSPSDANAGKQAAKGAFELGYRRGVLLGEAGKAYAEGLVNVFSETFYGMGGEIILRDTYEPNPQDNADIFSIIEVIQREQPDFIYIASQTTEAMENLILLIHDAGVSIPYFASEDAGDKRILELGPLVENLIFAQPTIDETRPEVAAFFEKYENRFGEVASLAPNYVASTYDAAHVIFDAIEYAGNNTSKAVEYLHNEIKGYAGVSNPNLFFDKHGDANQKFGLFQITGGTIVPYD